MEPRGLRLACPQCTLDVVMTQESDCPAPVTKVVEGVPWCPNCNIPMTPIASVDTTERPTSGVTTGMTLDQIAATCVELAHEAKDLADELAEAKEVHSQAKKSYDAKLVSLQLAVERMGRVQGGEQIEADKPLLEIAEQGLERCTAVTDRGDGVVVQCVNNDGHDGPHGTGDTSWASLEAPVGQPDHDAPTCRATDGDGHVCTEPAGHEGEHVATLTAEDGSGETIRELARWEGPEASRVLPMRGRKRGQEPVSV